MAEAYGKLTGRPIVCFVTRGPALIEVQLDPNILTPTLTIEGLRKRNQ